MRRSWGILILLAISGAHSGCIHPDMPQQCAPFFSMSRDERTKVFPTYSLEEQLIIYRCGMSRRPPETYLADYIADRGESAIPLLLTKLEHESDELTQVSIIEIFEVMAIKGHLRGKFDEINRIRTVVNRMRLPVYKDMGYKSLQKITQSSTRE